MASIPSPPVHHPSTGIEPPAHLLADEPDRPRYIRSPVYVLRLVVGAVVLLAGITFTVLFENALVGLFTDTNAMVESWPEWTQDVPVIVLAALAATIMVGSALWLVFTKHWRRLATISAAAILGAALSLLASVVVLEVATSDVLASVFDDDGPERRLSLFLPSLVAVVTVGIPWITRRIRPWVIAGTVLYGVALVFFAVSPPVVIVVDVGAGMFVGAALGLLLRTPNMAPTRAELAGALTHAALPMVELDRAAVDARGSAPWFGTSAEGQGVFVKVLGSDHRAADLLYRVYRWLRFRQVGDRRPFVSLRRAVEHEAFAALQASNRHISTPRFLAVADVGGDGIFLAYERIEGRSLDGIDPAVVTDEMLDQIWDLVTHLHEHGIAHRDLRLANMMVDDEDRPLVIDFGFAEMSAEPSQLARDVAEMLASTAAVVGNERAVAAAVRRVQPATLELAIAWLQPKAMSSATQEAVGGREAFSDLRERLQQEAEIDEVDPAKVERVNLRTVLILVSLGLAAYVLIPMIADSGDLWPTLREADLVWVIAALGASLLTYVGATIGILGALPCPVPVGSTFIAQLASSFTNRITPAKVGGMATNVRYLQLQGIPTSVAISAIGLNTLAGVMIHVPATIVLGVVAGREIAGFSLPSATAVGWVVAGFAALSIAVMGLPVGRRLVTESLLPALQSAFGSIGEVARQPAKLAQLFGGSFTVTSMYVVAMAASLAAFGSELELLSVAFVYLAGAAVASAAPTPGGVGATEAALAAGYSAVGVPPEIAISAVLVFRLLTFWLPILPGWVAFTWMQRTGRL